MYKLLYLSTLLVLVPAAAQSEYTLEGYATAGAEIEISSPDDGMGWSLTGTISQPITGPASVSEYSLEVGSWTFVTRTDHIIFSNSFEEAPR